MDIDPPNLGDKPFACAECGSRFRRKQDLQRHITVMRKKPSRRCAGGTATSKETPPPPITATPKAAAAPPSPQSSQQTHGTSIVSSSEPSLTAAPPISIAHPSRDAAAAHSTAPLAAAGTSVRSSESSTDSCPDNSQAQPPQEHTQPPKEPVHPGTFISPCFSEPDGHRPMVQAAPRRQHGPPTAAEALGVGLHESPILAQLKSLGTVPDPLLAHVGLAKNPFLPHADVTAFRIAYLELVQLHLTHSESGVLHDCLDDILQELDKKISLPRLPTMKKQILEHSPFVLKAKTTAITEGSRSFLFKFRPFIATMKALLQRSHLAQHYHVTPKYHVVAGDKQGVCSNACRQYSSIQTGLRWERLAAQLPEGHASVPYFLGSDKAVVFGQTVAWPIILHLAAYDKCIHNRPLIHTSFVLGYLVQPTKVHQDIESLSAARSATISKSVFHKCLAVLLDDEVRHAAEHGTEMRFPTGHKYMAHPQLLDYLGDLPEKALATLVKQNVACVQCCAPASSFDKRCKDSKQRSEEMIRHALDIFEEKGATKTLQEDWEKEHGVFLMPNALWELPHFDVHKSGLCDDLHQLYIGVFGRHLCGTLFEYMEQQPAVEQEFRLRLAVVPGFPTQQFHSLSSVTYSASQVTAATWKSLVHVMPALVHDLFDADPTSEFATRLRAVVPETFASFARLCNTLDRRCFTESQIEEVEEAIDDFFDAIPRYYEGFRKPPPSGALTLHTLNHADRSLRECGGLDEYSTGTRIELLHKFLVKLPGEFVNPRDVLEIGLFDYIQVHDAMTEHLAWLALYHPGLIADWSWGPSAEPIFELVDGVRDLGIPGVPKFANLAKRKKRGDSDSLAETDLDEPADWVSSAASIPEHPAALKFEQRLSLISRAAASVPAADASHSAHQDNATLSGSATDAPPATDPSAIETPLPATVTRTDTSTPPAPMQHELGEHQDSQGAASSSSTLNDSRTSGAPAASTSSTASAASTASIPASSPLLACIEECTAIADRNYESLLKLVNHDGGSRRWCLSTPLRQLRHWKDHGGTTLDKVIQTLGQGTFGGMRDALGYFALQFMCGMSDVTTVRKRELRRITAQIGRVMPYQRLDIHRVSRSRQVPQKDTVHGRATVSYNVLRRDFVLIRNMSDKSFQVFQPHIFLDISCAPNRSHRVAYGQLYQRVSEDVGTSRIPRIVKSGPLCVVPIECIHSAAHAIPEFALANPPPIASDPKPPAPLPTRQPPLPTTTVASAQAEQSLEPPPNGHAASTTTSTHVDPDSMIVDNGASALQSSKGKRKSSGSQSASGNGSKKRKKTQHKSQRSADGTTYVGHQFDCWLLNIYARAEVYSFQSSRWFDYMLF